MIIDIKSNIQDAIRYDLINLDTNQKITNAVYANDETGEYRIIDCYYFGGHMYKKSETITVKKGNIKLLRNKYYYIDEMEKK